jgi:hypothetical protein
MRDQYIFDIPVYRLTADEFDEEIDTASSQMYSIDQFV